MIGTFEVIGERENTFVTKRGTTVLQKIVALLDTTNPALINTVDYVLAPDEERLSGKLDRKKVVVEIIDLKVDFGGRFQIVGKLAVDKG